MVIANNKMIIFLMNNLVAINNINFQKLLDFLFKIHQTVKYIGDVIKIVLCCLCQST